MSMTRLDTLIDDNPPRFAKLAGERQASGSSLLAHTCEYKGLCAVAYPRLHSVQHTRDFHFFDATLLLVLSGKLHIQSGDGGYSVSDNAGICRVDSGLAADLSKFPAADGPFRSIYLTISQNAISRFYQRYPEMSVTSRQRPQAAILPTDEDLLTTFHQLLIDLEPRRLSAARLELRIFDLLLALAERGGGICCAAT